MLTGFPTTIFMLGIGGAGMQAQAQLLHAHGHTIVGSDIDVTKLAALPYFSAFTILPEDQATPLLESAELLIYTDAVTLDHPLRQYAQSKKIPQLMLFEAAGVLAQNFTCIAVTGTHGKSSTTAFLSHILSNAGIDPTVQLGARVVGWPLGNARVGQGKYFVVEADEYRQHFLHFNPAHIIITSIDFDHPDFFKNIDDVKQAYATFLKKLLPGGAVIALRHVIHDHPDLPWPATTVAVDSPTEPIVLPLPGTHMQSNAALAMALAEVLGVPTAQSLKALATFPGLSRRFETLGKLRYLTIVSDYGHHPTEIAATLAAARAWQPNAKIVAIVEPHTAARVNQFLSQYVSALTPELCDAVIVAPTFYVPGRDNQVAAIIATTSLYQALSGARSNVTQLANLDDIGEQLQQAAATYDLAIGFTAGVLDSKLRQVF